MRSLYDKIKEIITNEWNEIAEQDSGGISWAYKDDIERYLDRVYGIPVNKSDPIISKLKKAGVIDYIDTRRGEVKCVLGRATRKQTSLYLITEQPPQWDYNEDMEATIGFSRSMGISPTFQVMHRLKELCPEFDTEKETKYSRRRRHVRIKISKEKIIIEIRR